MTEPLGPLRLLMVTRTLVADDLAASRMRLKSMTSFFAPNKLIVVPFHRLFVTSCPLLARSSSWETLSSPSFAQTAVIAEAIAEPELSSRHDWARAFRRESAKTLNTTLQTCFERFMD